MENKKIGIFIGSLRKNSYSRAIAEYVASVAPAGYEFVEVPLGNLPFYNQDFDDEGPLPAAVAEFRHIMEGLEGFLFVTPEYNRSIPPVLKNALDTASRPMGQNLWSGKPGAIISVSPGGMGGMAANQQLRQPIGFLNIHLMKQPEVYLGNVIKLLDENNKLINPSTQEFLQGFTNSFIDWVKFINRI